MRGHNIHSQSEKLGVFGIYFIKDVLVTESKNAFSTSDCFIDLVCTESREDFLPGWIFHIFPEVLLFRQ